MSNVNPIKDTTEAIQGVLREIPIYQDLAQPAIQEAGKNLIVIGKTVKIILAPLQALVWGYETISEFIQTKVTEKLKNIPNENIVSPPLEIAGPTIEALRFAGNNKELRELYANLLANSMDISTIENTHPSFVEIIKNLCSDEALLLECFSKNESFPLIDIKSKEANNGFILVYQNHSNFNKILPQIKIPIQIPSYINNLCRLGILEIPALESLSDVSKYTELENDPALEKIKISITNQNKTITYGHKHVKLTALGNLFCKTVVVNKS